MQLFTKFNIHSSLQEYCNTFSHTLVERCPGQRTQTLILFVSHILRGRYSNCVVISARMSIYSRGHGAANITAASIMTYTCMFPFRTTKPDRTLLRLSHYCNGRYVQCISYCQLLRKQCVSVAGYVQWPVGSDGQLLTAIIHCDGKETPFNDCNSQLWLIVFLTAICYWIV